MYKTILLSAFLVSVFKLANTQELSKEALCKKWNLDQYIIDLVEYEPEKKERGDYISFHVDGNYTACSEGEIEHGSWLINKNGNYILLKKEKEQKYKAYVVSIAPEELVLKFDIQEIRDIKIRYKSDG